ncbi:EAL domain-containing protein [Pseudodonghicola flavimaris]|uniref:EAL domain-containing protein n=1 Tax=Pseudodonghicola flavimaris TaxID=3050036 RepID=A0ABT7EX92_9RHOB|nr:EAL domain-containing protein [Pseudodonghicola flavimaris]MDK3016962.1 EAL domain-containing protein [Pseudodonghicola flavimaris]
MYSPRTRWADQPEGSENPLNAALAARDRSTIDMVTEAVRHKQCLLAFQPVVQARAPHNVAFYEGLIRILDETGRVIPARDFMPVVENTELGREIDCLALEAGLQALAENPTLRLSINMSARSIGYSRWMQTLNRALNLDNRIGERLTLEIAESSAMMVPELVIDFMDRLQGNGIAFALDDFGSGAINIRHFRDFFFDAVKIDGQYVRGVHRDYDTQAALRALVAMAREFEMLIIAESVEASEDAEYLMSLGIDCMQGYLFGAPTIRPDWADEDSQAAAG